MVTLMSIAQGDTIRDTFTAIDKRQASGNKASCPHVVGRLYLYTFLVLYIQVFFNIIMSVIRHMYVWVSNTHITSMDPVKAAVEDRDLHNDGP